MWLSSAAGVVLKARAVREGLPNAAARYSGSIVPHFLVQRLFSFLGYAIMLEERAMTCWRKTNGYAEERRAPEEVAHPWHCLDGQ
jgi:hypothetical protein